MNITLSIPKKNVKIVGDRATISVSPKKLEQAFCAAEKKMWEEKILACAAKIDPKNLSKNTFAWEEIEKARARK